MTFSAAPVIELIQRCHTCKKQHRIRTTARGLSDRLAEWLIKHPPARCRVDAVSPRRSIPRKFDDRIYDQLGRGPWWLEYKENANIQIAYGASAALTITLASLATSSGLTVGRESTAVVNTTNLYVDYILSGDIMVGTTPTTATIIQIWLYGSQNDTPAYPDVITGTDANATITSTAIRNACLNFWADTGVDSATSNRPYSFKPKGIATAFDYVVPKNWGVFVSHSCVSSLNATGTNHFLNYTGIYFTG